MTEPRKTKILNRFLKFILPFGILCVIVTGVVISWTNYTHFRRSVTEDYRNIVNASAGEIRQYMENARTDLMSLAWILRATSPDAWRTELTLTAFLHAKP